MHTPDDAEPNADQIEYWNEDGGPQWVQCQDAVDRQIEPLGLHAMDLAKIEVGERVLDVGCGCGQTTIELARRVGAAGRVHGVDVSAPMLARARRRAGESERIEWIQSDVQTHPFEDDAYDLAFSRFGVMFFDDPTAAFANVRRALRPGGRVSFACWQDLEHNEWMRETLRAVGDLVELPPPPPPTAPGPRAFADPDRVARLFADAGFEDFSATPVSRELTIGGGGSLEDAVEFLLKIGPAVRTAMSAGLEDLAPLRERWLRDLAPYATPCGVVMGSGMWVFRARNLG